MKNSLLVIAAFILIIITFINFSLLDKNLFFVLIAICAALLYTVNRRMKKTTIGLIFLSIIALPFLMSMLDPSTGGGPIGNDNSLRSQFFAGLLIGVFGVWPISIYIGLIILPLYGIYKTSVNAQMSSKDKLYWNIAMVAVLALLLLPVVFVVL
jgi:hypothetical protein